MNLRILKLICIFIFFAFFLQQKILAQCYIIPGYHWPSNSATYYMNSNLQTTTATQQDFETAIQAAATQWSNAGSNFTFNKGPDVSYDMGTEPDGINQVGYYFPVPANPDHAITVVDWSGTTISE